MRYVYEQRTGRLWLRFGPGPREFRLVGIGFAGREAGRNSPAHQHVRGVGPLPQGEYLMRVVEHKRFAPPAIRLTQEKGQTYGRSGFLIHGGTKSEGCIILDRYARQAIAATLGLRGGTATLAVIAG